jgi:hypothetical protein
VSILKDRRRHEWGIPPKRRWRFFKSGNAWYYDTREGLIRGPFDLLPEAEMDAAEYISTLIATEPMPKSG